MKKRLLLQFLAVLCAVGVYAAEGDYVYSSTQKFKITGANIFQNGDFRANDAGWLNPDGESKDNEVWGIETEGLNLPEGVTGYAIKSLGAKTDTLTTLTNVQQIPAGAYVFTYWVKAESNINTSVVYNGNNYVDFAINDTGVRLVARGVDAATDQFIAGVTNYSTEWKQVVYFFETTADGYFVFNARNVASGTMFADFQIAPASEVYDTRVAERLLKYIQGILAEEGFDQGEARAALEEIAGAIEETLTLDEFIADRESPDAMAELLSETDELIKAYLDASAGNLVGTTDDNGNSTTRYLDDWAKRGYYNWNNMSAYGNWTFTGGRWGFSPNDESLERPAGDGYVASAGIQTSYTLDGNGVYINPNAFNNTSFGPGRYMFTIEAQAVAALNKAAPYGANEGVEIKGPSIWVGKDTVKLSDVVLDNHNWQKLYLVAEIENDTVTAGFLFPTVEGNQGGRYSLRNPEFRFVGQTQQQIDHLYGYDQLQVQQKALKERLELAAADQLKTKADGYPWGHAVLKDSIDKFTAVYNELLTVVDAEGNELQPDKVTLEYKDEILAAVQAMNSARNNFASTNRVFQTLKADIEVCNASLNDEANAAGDKATFKAVIDQAQAMVDATQTDADEVDAFNAKDDEMLVAKEEFEKSTASRAHPANLYVKNKNLNFESWTSKSTYSSDRTVNGWEFTIGADGKQWDVTLNSAYEFGHRVSIWRGSSVGPNGRVRQVAKVTTPGVYEFRTRAFSAEYGDGAKWNEYMNIASICGSVLDWDTFENAPVDTIYKPNVRVFFGPVGAVNDSVTLTKCAPADYLRNPYSDALVYTRETGLNYSVILVKNTPATDSLEVEFGLEAYENGATSGACTFGMGDNRFLYLGPEAAYTTATDADYQAEVTKAKALIAKYGTEDPTVGWMVYKLMRLVGDTNYPWTDGFGYTAPATLQEKQNVYLSLIEVEDMINYTIDPTTLGISEVATESQNQTLCPQTGIFSINGTRMGNHVKSLPRGLYIINGKKVVIR